MDLAFIAKSLSGAGGTERDLEQLIRALLRRGHRVTAYLGRTGGAVPAGCRVVRVPKIAPGALAALWSLAWLGPRLAYRGGHDLVIGFTRLLRQDVVRCGGGTHTGVLEALEAAGPRWRGRVRRLDPKHRSLLTLERLQYRPGRYRHVLAISEGVKADLMRVHGIPAEAVTVIPDGVDTTRFHPGLRDRHRARVREELGIPPDAPCFLFVGNGFRRKGLEGLLRAAARFREHEARVLVVGADPEAAHYRRLAAELGLGGRAVFAGRQAEPERFYGAADALVLPSVQEAFGNVVLEALACGLPVMVSHTAGAAAALEGDLAVGLLENPQDPVALHRQMEAVLPWALSGELAESARAAAERFSLEAHVDRTEALFRRLANSGSPDLHAANA